MATSRAIVRPPSLGKEKVPDTGDPLRATYQGRPDEPLERVYPEAELLPGIGTVALAARAKNAIARTAAKKAFKKSQSKADGGKVFNRTPNGKSF